MSKKGGARAPSGVKVAMPLSGSQQYTTYLTRVKGSQQYPYPSHVNAASFLSIKLFGVTNYPKWKEQIKCLLDSHDMLDFIKPTKIIKKNKEWKRSDALVKGWIFGSLSENVMDAVVGLGTAHVVWKKLGEDFKTLHPNPKPSAASYEVWTKYRPLYEAILNGDWATAEVILNEDEKALTAKFNDNNDSALHVAISTCKNNRVVEKLLERIKDLLNDDLRTRWGKMNPLHRAAIIGNTKAAEMLVEKEPRLLCTMDEKQMFPIHRAIMGSHIETFLYLLRVTKEYCKENPTCNSPFEGKKCGVLLVCIINEELFDVAYDIVKEYPCMAIMKDGKRFIPLKMIAGKPDPYFSGAEYNFYQRFVYSYVHVPKDNDAAKIQVLENQDAKKDNVHTDNAVNIQDLENQDANNVNVRTDNAMIQDTENQDANNVNVHSHKADKIEDHENQDTNKVNFDAKCSRSSFQSVIQMINLVKYLKVALLQVTQIKHLGDEKLKHNKSLMLLKVICQEVSKIGKNGKMEQVGDIHEHYYEAIALALENDNREAIEEIIRTFPQAILTIHNGYHVTQFAIVNRCAKVYNFLAYHVLMTDRHIHKKMVDNDGNTLLHLAGLLAPIDKLNQVSGAALQMQRELQWFEEVETFVLKKHRKRMNNNDETPMMVFRRAHTDLRKEGEAWMRKTANSYTITATLIITIVFAAAITVPGGNDGNTGKAIFANESSFIIFAVSDAMSLFASTTSLLLFLSILTTRYRDEDFLYSLPKRLILGLAMLFLSVSSMMVAFSATLYIVFGQERKWILIPISTLTCLPIASFVTLQFPLLVELISSTYGQGIFVKERNRSWMKCWSWFKRTCCCSK